MVFVSAGDQDSAVTVSSLQDVVGAWERGLQGWGEARL